jgi:hypothetical protein
MLASMRYASPRRSRELLPVAWVAILGAALVWLSASPCAACGVSGPDGVWSCSLEEHEEEERPRWSVGAVGVYTWAKLRLDSDLRVDAERSGVLVSGSYAPTSKLRIQASAGAALTGQLHMPDGVHDFDPGPTGAVGITYRFLKDKPFIVLSAIVSASTARTHARAEPEQSARYTALDLRFGCAVGATFFESLSPYAVVRLFGGPIFWHYQGEKLLGTDAYHVQLGAGLSYRIARRVDVFVEGVPLGERALSGGAAVVF